MTTAPATAAGLPLVPDSRRGWVTVAAAFAAMAVAFAVGYNFGSLVGPMAGDLDVDRGTIGWVFSVSSFMFLALGTLTGGLADRFGPRPLLAAGGVFIAAGLALAAVAGHIAVAIIAYTAVGVGIGCVYVPSVVAVGAWFVRYRVQALGIAVTGIGVGTIIGPIVTAALVDAFGWRRTDLIVGAVALVLLLACTAAMPGTVPVARQVSTWRVSRLVRDRTFQMLYAAGFLTGLVVYVPFVFLAPLAQHTGIEPIRAATLVSAIGFASAGARLVFGFVAVRVGVITAYKVACGTIWLGFLVWLPARSYWALLVFAVIFGAGYGGSIALLPAVLGHYYGVAGLGTVAGTLYTSASIGSLFGAPLAGVLIGAADRYTMTAVVLLIVATLGTAGQALLPRQHPNTP